MNEITSHDKMTMGVIKAHHNIEAAISKAVPSNQEDLTRASPNAVSILPPDWGNERKITVIIAVNLANLQLNAPQKLIQVRPILWTFRI